MARANKLGLPCVQSVRDKKTAIMQYLREKKIDPKNVIFVGNDINDKEAMEYVGWPIAPADAHADVKKVARIVLKAKGGHGVVRELLDEIKRKMK